MKKGLSGTQLVWIVAGVIVGVIALVLLSALVTMLAWNIGVVALVAATGATIGKISFDTAFWIYVALAIIRGDQFRANAKASKNNA